MDTLFVTAERYPAIVLSLQYRAVYRYPNGVEGRSVSRSRRIPYAVCVFGDSMPTNQTRAIRPRTFAHVIRIVGVIGVELLVCLEQLVLSQFEYGSEIVAKFAFFGQIRRANSG
jgi:hypothetical protein